MALESLSWGPGFFCGESWYRQECVWKFAKGFDHGLPRYDLTSCLNTFRTILIGCHGQTIKDIPNKSNAFVRLSPEMLYTEFDKNWSKIEGGEAFLLIFTKFKMAENLSWRKMTSQGALDSSWPKDSRDTKFLKIGHTVQKLWAKLYLQKPAFLTCWWR